MPETPFPGALTLLGGAPDTLIPPAPQMSLASFLFDLQIIHHIIDNKHSQSALLSYRQHRWRRSATSTWPSADYRSRARNTSGALLGWPWTWWTSAIRSSWTACPLWVLQNIIIIIIIVFSLSRNKQKITTQCPIFFDRLYEDLWISAYEQNSRTAPQETTTKNRHRNIFYFYKPCARGIRTAYKTFDTSRHIIHAHPFDPPNCIQMHSLTRLLWISIKYGS